MRVQDLMSQPAVTCHVNDPLILAAQRMWDHDCGSLAIVNDEGVLTGMLTDRDICMAAFTQGRSLDQMLVNSAMAHHVVSANSSATVSEVEQLMADHQVRRVPIIDDAGHPLGVISLNDIAIEAAQPDSRMRHALQKVAHTLAAICRPRAAKHVQAA